MSSIGTLFESMALSLVHGDGADRAGGRFIDLATALHLRLGRLGKRRLCPSVDGRVTRSDLRDEMDDLWEEERFVTVERAAIASQCVFRSIRALVPA